MQKVQMREDWATQASNDRKRKDMEDTERKKVANMSFGPQVPPAPTLEEAVMKTLINSDKRRDMLS